MPWSLANREDASDLAALCHGLADTKRVLLLAALREGEHSVGELAVLIDAPQPSVSHHLGVLRSRGLVDLRRSGTKSYYRTADRRVTDALDTLYGLVTREPGGAGQRLFSPTAPPPPSRQG